MRPINIVDIAKNQKEFDAAFGRAMREWGIIEQRLCFWFVYLTQMPDAMARSIFYDGANSFSARNNLLRCALETSKTTEQLRKCMRTILSKAHAYNGTRNALAHCETKIDMNPNSPTRAQVVLVEGSQPLADMKIALTVANLPTISTNFGALSKLIMDVYQNVHLHDEASFRKFREQVHALPSSAVETLPNQNPLKD
jgi:hypothetical protein